MASKVTSLLPPELARYVRRIAKRIPLESGNYPYVTARVRAKKTLLLSEDTYAKMLQMEIPQIARILGEGVYKAEILALAPRLSGVDLIEVATNRNMAAVFTQIINFSEGELRQMIALYLDRFDVHNIKTIVRGKTFGATGTEILEDLVPAGSMDERFLREIIELPSLDEVFDRLEESIYGQALEQLGKKPAEMELWNEWEDLVTNLYYQNLLAVVPHPPEAPPLMREFLRREVDIVNLKTLLRLWASRVRLTYDPFIDGGWELATEALAFASSPTISARLKELEALGVGQLVRSVEKLHLLEAGRYAHVNPLSVLPVLDYIVRKEREVQNLRIITRGKESGLSSDVIRDLLVI